MVDDGTVRAQETHDAKGVTIITGLLLAAAMLVLGLLLLWMSDELIGLPQDVSSSLAVVLEATAIAVLFAYVARRRRL